MKKLLSKPGKLLKWNKGLLILFMISGINEYLFSDNALCEINISKIEKVNDKIINGQFAAANAHNNQINAPNYAAQHQKRLNKLLLKQLNGNNFNIQDSVELFSLASDCPLYGGLSVYQARIKYNEAFNDFYLFDDANCIDLTSARLTNTSNEETTSFEKKEFVEAKIYPNPNNGVFYIEVNGLKSNTQLEITTIDGKVIKQYNLNENINIYTVEMANLATGIYFCRIKQGVNILKTNKIVLYNEN